MSLQSDVYIIFSKKCISELSFEVKKKGGIGKVLLKNADIFKKKLIVFSV